MLAVLSHSPQRQFIDDGHDFEEHLPRFLSHWKGDTCPILSPQIIIILSLAESVRYSISRKEVALLCLIFIQWAI